MLVEIEVSSRLLCACPSAREPCGITSGVWQSKREKFGRIRYRRLPHTSWFVALCAFSLCLSCPSCLFGCVLRACPECVGPSRIRRRRWHRRRRARLSRCLEPWCVAQGRSVSPLGGSLLRKWSSPTESGIPTPENQVFTDIVGLRFPVLSMAVSRAGAIGSSGVCGHVLPALSVWARTPDDAGPRAKRSFDRGG